MLSCFSHVHLHATPWTVILQAPLLWDSPGKNDRVSCHGLLQGIFLTWGSNLSLLCLLHWQTDCLPLAQISWINFKINRDKGICLFVCSVTQSCPTLCNPMDCGTPGLPVHYHLPQSAQVHINRIGDVIQPSHPLSASSPFCLQSFPASGTFPMIPKIQ